MSELMTGVLLEINADAIVNWLDEVGAKLVSDAEGIAPHLLYSIFFLVLGIIGAKIAQRAVQRISQSMELDELVRDTLLDDGFLSETQTIGQLLGTLTALYIYLLTALLVANEFALGRVASALNGVIGFIPTAIVAFGVLAIGFWLADLVEERVSAAAPEDDDRIGGLFGMALQVFVYLVAIVVAFSVLAGTSGGAGFAIPIMQVFTLGFALAFILALAVGAKEYLDAGAEEAS